MKVSTSRHRLRPPCVRDQISKIKNTEEAAYFLLNDICAISRALTGPLGGPGGYLGSTYGQRSVDLGSTFGQPRVNVRSTYGQPTVFSLAISGRFSLILPDCSIKTENTRTCISELIDFPIRKWDFRVRGWSGAFWEPQMRKKKRKPNVPTRSKNLCTAPISKFCKILTLFKFIFLNFQKILTNFLLIFTVKMI